MAKRGNNEGTIFQTADKKWCAFVHLGYRNGKRHRKKFTGLTRKDVQDKLNVARRAIDSGEGVATSRLTVSEYLESWLRDSAKQALRPSTYQSYARLIHAYLIPRLGRVELARLKAPEIRRCLNELLDCGGVEKRRQVMPGGDPKLSRRPLSARTVQYCHAVLRTAMSQAVKDGLIPRNVSVLVDAPKVKHHEIQPFTPEQARQLLDAVKGNRLEALFTVAVSLGLRQGEILGLRWVDIDLDRRVLHVRHALQRVAGKPEFVEPKTSRSRRCIALPEITVRALVEHQRRQLVERDWAGTRWKDWNLVFTSTIGTPLESTNLNHRFQDLATTAGLPKIRFHDLRHTAATLLLAQGVHARIVMDMMGHSQISLTMNTYSHVIPAMREAVADHIDAVLRPVATRVATASDS